MKRDIELIRKILLYVEANHQPRSRSVKEPYFEEYDTFVVREHCRLFEESGLVRPFAGTNIGGLTTKGHDYIENIRSDEIWEKTKKVIENENLPRTLDTIASVAGTFIGAVINQIKE